MCFVSVKFAHRSVCLSAVFCWWSGTGAGVFWLLCILALLILIGMGRDGSEVSLPPRQQTCCTSQRLFGTALLSKPFTPCFLLLLLSVLHGYFEGRTTDMFAHKQADGVTFLDEEHCCHDVRCSWQMAARWLASKLPFVSHTRRNTMKSLMIFSRAVVSFLFHHLLCAINSRGVCSFVPVSRGITQFKWKVWPVLCCS